MSIVRVYVRTFQNETNKSQVTSIWKYEDEKHLKTVRTYLANMLKCQIHYLQKKLFTAVK